jgi:hypothetical protein
MRVFARARTFAVRGHVRTGKEPTILSLLFRVRRMRFGHVCAPYPRPTMRLRPQSSDVWKTRSRQMSPRVCGCDHVSVAVS